MIDQSIYSGDFFPSLWVSEGLASYFGLTYRDATGSFRAGAVGGKSIELLKDVKGGGKESRAVLQNAKSAFKSPRGKDGSLVDSVLGVEDPGRFYGENAAMYYSVSWLVVHYLLHGENGSLAGRFMRYLQLESRGEGGADALYAVLELGPAELNAATAKYLRGLKSR